MQLVHNGSNEDDTLDGTDYMPPGAEAAVPRIKRKTLVAPWKNIEEFHQVYDWLFAPTANHTSSMRALDQMRIWSLRRSSLCPAAVLSTIVLLEVKLNDALAVMSEELQCTLYASAFTRFFNYMSSIMQTHSMRTMYETAQQLGLATFVVDLRHICAHGQTLPPLQVLQTTAQYCFSWLHDYYWSEQRAVMCNVDAGKIRRKDKTQFDENVSHLFSIYDAALECYLKGARDIKTAKRTLHGNRMAQLKQFYKEKELTTLRAAFDAIVRELAQLVRRETTGIKDYAEIYIEAWLKMNYFFVVADKHTSTEEELHSLIEVTQGLFRMLAIQGFIDELLLSLMKIAESVVATKARRAGASFWARQIVLGFVAFRKCKQLYKAELDQHPNMKDCNFSTMNFDSISKRAKKLLIYSGIDIKSTLIFGDSMRRPWVWIFERAFVEQHLETINEYTAPVIKCLLPLVDPALTQTETKVLEDLIDVAYANIEANVEQKIKQSSVDKVYTAQDLLEKLQETTTMDIDDAEQQEELTDGLQKYGIWSTLHIDETQDWSICPLGRLPWE